MGDVREFIKNRGVCQCNKLKIHFRSGYYNLFLYGYKSKGKDSIFVVVDKLSKFAHFIPLKHPYSASVVVISFCHEVIRLHGIPVVIISDRDRVFMSQFWKEIFTLQGTTLKRSTAYHPQTDGQTEIS
jgi:hypothetical protein